MYHPKLPIFSSSNCAQHKISDTNKNALYYLNYCCLLIITIKSIIDVILQAFMQKTFHLNYKCNAKRILEPNLTFTLTFKKLANQVKWFFRVYFFAARLSWLFNTVFIGMNPYVTVYSTFSTLIIIGFDSFPNRERKKSQVLCCGYVVASLAIEYSACHIHFRPV